MRTQGMVLLDQFRSSFTLAVLVLSLCILASQQLSSTPPSYAPERCPSQFTGDNN